MRETIGKKMARQRDVERALHEGRTTIWCSCGNWWHGGDPDHAAHMHAHPLHVWWSEHYAPPPYRPHWPPRETP